MYKHIAKVVFTDGKKTRVFVSKGEKEKLVDNMYAIYGQPTLVRRHGTGVMFHYRVERHEKGMVSINHYIVKYI